MVIVCQDVYRILVGDFQDFPGLFDKLPIRFGDLIDFQLFQDFQGSVRSLNLRFQILLAYNRT